MRRPASFFAASVSLLVSAACATYDSSLLVDQGAAGGGTGGSDAGSGGAGATGPGGGSNGGGTGGTGATLGSGGTVGGGANGGSGGVGGKGGSSGSGAGTGGIGGAASGASGAGGAGGGAAAGASGTGGSAAGSGGSGGDAGTAGAAGDTSVGGTGGGDPSGGAAGAAGDGSAAGGAGTSGTGGTAAAGTGGTGGASAGTGGTAGSAGSAGSSTGTGCVTTPEIVISQIYGGGGNTLASYENDFVELFNRSDHPVDLGGHALEYASATGLGWGGPNVTALSGVVPPGGYFLVKFASDLKPAPPLPPADATGATNLSGTAGKIALLTTTVPSSTTCPVDPTVLDIVPYGATDCAPSAPTLGGVSSRALFRKNGGCSYTGNAMTDFVGSVPPMPRNSATPPAPCAVSACQ